MHTASFYHTAPDGVLQCDLCRHYCRIRPGRSGLCRVRKNIDGRLIAITYGRALSQSADPVEKKPLYHFMPGTATWSFGTAGCNFTCANCQNWQISQALPDEETAPFIPPEKIVQNAIRAGCPSISCTYTEPTIFAEYALDVMKLAKESGLKTIWVSNGYLSPLCLDTIHPWLDAINVDLKSMDDAFYRRLCGARLAPVLDSLRQIRKSGIHLEITTLVIPGHADDPAMLERLAGFIADELGSDVPWHLIPFYPEISWKMHETPGTEPSVLETAWQIGRNAELQYVYSASHNATLCSHCGATLVARERQFIGAQVKRFDAGGRCPSCNQPSPVKN